MKLKVIYTDGREVEAFAGPRAQVELERRYDVAFMAAFDRQKTGGAPRFEHIYFLGWAAVYYTGLDETADYDAWLSAIRDVELVDEDAEPDPTQPGQPSAD